MQCRTALSISATSFPKQRWPQIEMQATSGANFCHSVLFLFHDVIRFVDPCSDVYQGVGGDSEPETNAVVNSIKERTANLKTAIAIHR